MIYKYTKKKKEVIEQLKVLAKQLDAIESKIGVEFNKELKQKIGNAISNIVNEKFLIVFFGAFSDGKSTLLSALTKSFDIKISVEPSTDEIKEYKYEDYFIVDTPGLFSEELLHDEKTKRYISEANVIIYTVDAVNPLKESHNQTLEWLLKDLGKADSTIFVINKMDEVADLEDQDDFKENCEIKKEVVRNTLKKIMGIPDFQRIVCVSGDPFGLGLKEWFSKENDYRKFSRIGNLENIISEFVEKAKEDLITKSGLSVIKDTVLTTLKEIESLSEKLKDEIILLNNQVEEYENKLNVLEKDINRSYSNIKRDVLSFRADILQEVETTSDIQGLVNVCVKRFGKEGYVIKEEIDLIIRRHTDNLLGESKNFLKELEESLEYHADLAKEFLNSASGYTKNITQVLIATPTRQIADAVLKVRNLLKLPIKFKPWGALRWAKWIKNLPIIMQLIDIFGKVAGKIIYEKNKEKVIQEIENFFKDFLNDLTPKEYKKEFFPYVFEVEKILSDLKNYRDEVQKNIETMETIMMKLKSFT